MPNHTLTQKTLIAVACGLLLIACGEKREPAQDVTPTAAAAPAPLAPSKDALSKLAMGKMQASDQSKQANAEVAEPSDAAASNGGAIPVAAMTMLPASSAIGTQGRKLVLTASARFAVKNTYASALAIEDAAAAHGGYVVKNDLSTVEIQQIAHIQSDVKPVRVALMSLSADILVRVPSGKTQAFLREIASQVEWLEQRNFAARDVQFDMLRSQLEAARGQDAQTELGALVKQPGYVSEKGAIIEARSQAKASRDEARIAQAQLADQVAFSTISLGIYQPSQVRTTPEPDFEAAVAAHSPSFGTEVQRALAGGWNGMLRTLVWAVALWPLWLVLMAAGGAVAVYRSRRQRKAVA